MQGQQNKKISCYFRIVYSKSPAQLHRLGPVIPQIQIIRAPRTSILKFKSRRTPSWAMITVSILFRNYTHHPLIRHACGNNIKM